MKLLCVMLCYVFVISNFFFKSCIPAYYLKWYSGSYSPRTVFIKNGFAIQNQSEGNLYGNGGWVFYVCFFKVIMCDYKYRYALFLWLGLCMFCEPKHQRWESRQRTPVWLWNMWLSPLHRLISTGLFIVSQLCSPTDPALILPLLPSPLLPSPLLPSFFHLHFTPDCHMVHH